VLQVFQRNADLHGLYGELFDFACKEAYASIAPRRRLGYHSANAGKHFEEALGGQLRDHFLGGIGVNFHGASQGADGRKGVAGAELAGENGFFGGKDNLVRDGDAGLRNEPEWDHMCNMAHVTVKVKAF
jgi:hypothetical protein